MGRVKRENGIWYFTNRYGKTNSKVRGPFEQAKDGIFSIVDAMKKRVDIEHHHIPNVLFGYGVMFPDIEYAPPELTKSSGRSLIPVTVPMSSNSLSDWPKGKIQMGNCVWAT